MTKTFCFGIQIFIFINTKVISRRGHEGGETGEIPHPKVLGWDRVGTRVGNLPTLFWAQKQKNVSIFLKTFVISQDMTSSVILEI